MPSLDFYFGKKETKPEPEKPKVKESQKLCGCGKQANIKCKDKYYCMSCWHKYPEGFLTTGWDFI